MLDVLRRNTKVVLWITVASFVLLIFLVWGAETQIGCGGNAPGVIGRVNGQTISVEYFNRVYQASRENFRSSRGVDPGPGDDALILQQTWDGIVEQMIMTQEAEKRGLVPTDEEIVYEARNNPPAMLTQNPAFQTNGQFDQQKYLSFLDNPQVEPAFFTQLETYLREMVPVEKLTALIYSAARVSEPEVKESFRERYEQARVTYRLFELRNYTLPQPVTDAEAEAWFKAHPDEFDLPSQATVRYVKLDRQPTEADVQGLKEQVADYAAIARRFASGDSSALSFSALAETYSDLPSAPEGGFVDRFYGRGELAPELETTVFSLPAGAISDPIQDRNGIHIVQVDSIMPDAAGSRVRFRDLMLRIEPGDDTITGLEDKMTAFRENAAKGKFDAAATAAGLTPVTAPSFGQAGFIRGLEQVAGAPVWAFKAEPGSVSPVFTTNDAWYVLELVSRSEAGKPAYKDVSELAKQKATEDRQRELARKDAEAFLAVVRTASNWRGVAGADSNQVRTVGPFSRTAGIPGVGREGTEALGATFSLPIGQAAGPLNVPRGVMVMRVEERTPADETLFEAQKGQIAQQLSSQRRTEVYQDWMRQMKEKAEIKDYRELFFRS